MNPVVHFEMPYRDRDRMASFYQSAFGWQSQMMGPEMGNYVVVTTTDTDESGMVTTPGTINGGFFGRMADQPEPHTSIVIAVDDIRAAMQKVSDSGGTVHGDPMDIPGVGQYVPFTDTEGNKASILQPLPRG